MKEQSRASFGVSEWTVQSGHVDAVVSAAKAAREFGIFRRGRFTKGSVDGTIKFKISRADQRGYSRFCAVFETESKKLTEQELAKKVMARNNPYNSADTDGITIYDMSEEITEIANYAEELIVG